MGELILVTGGARSGKSDFAERLAVKLGGDEVLFVATAEALDDDMARRIAAHRLARPTAWQTLEAPQDVAKRLLPAIGTRRVVLIDCLTLLVSNTILTLGESPDAPQAEALVRHEVDELLAATQATPATIIVVTNEVGLGLVPMNTLGRVYRDALGRANQRLAAQADAVYALLSGIALDIKRLASNLDDERD
jgi:adenosyl cobinamide kinase/adenosyl cobinamide phosphate guanylyltransferase